MKFLLLDPSDTLFYWNYTFVFLYFLCIFWCWCFLVFIRGWVVSMATLACGWTVILAVVIVVHDPSAQPTAVLSSLERKTSAWTQWKCGRSENLQNQRRSEDLSSLFIHLMLDSAVAEQKCYKGVWLHRNRGNVIMSSKISIVTIPQRAFLNLFFILPRSTVALHSSTSENWAGSTTSHPQRCIISRITANSPTMHHKWRTSFTSLLFLFFTFYSCFL